MGPKKKKTSKRRRKEEEEEEEEEYSDANYHHRPAYRRGHRPPLPVDLMPHYEFEELARYPNTRHPSTVNTAVYHGPSSIFRSIRDCNPLSGVDPNEDRGRSCRVLIAQHGAPWSFASALNRCINGATETFPSGADDITGEQLWATNCVPTGYRRDVEHFLSQLAARTGPVDYEREDPPSTAIHVAERYLLDGQHRFIHDDMPMHPLVRLKKAVELSRKPAEPLNYDELEDYMDPENDEYKERSSNYSVALRGLDALIRKALGAGMDQIADELNRHGLVVEDDYWPW